MAQVCKRLSMTQFVCRTVADACQVPLAQLDLETQLATLNMDSLTLLSVVTRAQAVYGLSVTSDLTLRLFEAHDIADLVAALEPLEQVSKQT